MKNQKLETRGKANPTISNRKANGVSVRFAIKQHKVHLLWLIEADMAAPRTS